MAVFMIGNIKNCLGESVISDGQKAPFLLEKQGKHIIGLFVLCLFLITFSKLGKVI